jgi:hypothetical protein
MIDRLLAVAPVLGMYLFLLFCLCALVAAWIWWEDRAEPNMRESLDLYLNADPWPWADEAIQLTKETK